MPKKHISSRECAENCKSVNHCGYLVSAITQPLSAVTDKQLASFLKSKCYGFDTVHDECGRKLLHVAASCGRKDLCQWLIKCTNANIDDQDTESGYTSLHRSILYGYINVTVSLMRLGASVTVRDREDFCPIDLTLKNLDLDMTHFIYSGLVPKDILFTVAPKPGSKKQKNSDVSYDELLKTSNDQISLLKSYSSIISEVYTWGLNNNYTIGFGAESSKAHPEYLEFFEKKNEIIKEVCMHKYHTLFVSLSGNVWCCGLGQGGRLGLSSDDTVLIPQKITLTSSSRCCSSTLSTQEKKLFCLKAAVGADHSIFMCNDNQVLTCGMNTYHQLGISPPPANVSKPRLVEIELWSNRVFGVAASTFHSVIWTGFSVYTCGLHAGQLGHEHSNSKTIPNFKKVPSIEFHFTSIEHVVVSEGATVIVTAAHDIYLVNRYKCQKIDIRYLVDTAVANETNKAERRRMRGIDLGEKATRSESISKVSVHGGELDMEKVKPFNSSYRPEPLKIVILLCDGSVFLWQENATRFLKCNFLLKHEIKVYDFVLNSSGIFLCSFKGEAFEAHIQSLIKTFRKLNDGFTTVHHRNAEEADECYLLELKKIRNAHRAVAIFSDPKGDNFAILQSRSVKQPESIPQIESSTFSSDFETLYYETCEDDSFHDIIYRLGRKTFPAHKYIVAVRCKDLKLCKENEGIVVIDNIHPEIFEQLLMFVYLGTNYLLREGPCRIRIPKSAAEKYSSVKFEDPIKLAIKAAEEFKMEEYIKELQYFRYENEYILQRSDNCGPVRAKPLRLNRLEFKNFCDIKLKSQEGQIFNAHKCILVARMQYFKSMLCGSWIETCNQNREYHMPVSSAVLLEILEFVYSDTVAKSVNKKDLNFWCSLLVAADQFILPKLKEISEKAIASCLDTRNVCDILIFAETLSAYQLKTACFEFICINLTSLLYSRNLDKLKNSILDELSMYYKTEFSRMNYFAVCKRNFPVYDNVYKLEEIVTAENSFPVDWNIIYESSDENDVVQKPSKVIQKKKKKRPCKTVSPETECVSSKEQFSEISPEKIYQCHENILKTDTPWNKETKAEEWTEVDRHVKSVKARLKVNAAVRDCPQLVEQKENYISLTQKTSPSISVPVESKHEKICDSPQSPRSFSYMISFDFHHVTPKLSQKQTKRLRRLSESMKSESGNFSPPKTTLYGTSLSPPASSHFETSAAPQCWGGKGDAKETVSFSAIMASEMKQKTMVKKETKKVEMKSLHLTQIEDKAIHELAAFYNASNIDDEVITVERVIYNTAVPRWVTK